MKQCLNCFKEFYSARKESKFCCAACSNKFKGRAIVEKNKQEGKYIRCVTCGKQKAHGYFSFKVKNDFTSGRKDQCKRCGANEREMARRNKTWKDDAARILLNGSKHRAKKAGIIHTLTYADIKIPDMCPVLGVPLKRENRETWMFAPSIDRIDNTIGYIPENIIIVSRRANILKKDATVDELIKLAEFYSKVR